MKKRLKKKRFFRILNKFLDLNKNKKDFSDYYLELLLRREILRLENSYKEYKFIQNNKDKIADILSKGFGSSDKERK